MKPWVKKILYRNTIRVPARCFHCGQEVTSGTVPIQEYPTLFCGPCVLKKKRNTIWTELFLWYLKFWNRLMDRVYFIIWKVK